MGDISAQIELSKLFKPITETQKDIKESLVSELRPIKESLKELPAYPQLQAIAAPPKDEDEEEKVMQVRKIAHKYLSDYAAKQNVGMTFGLYKNPLNKLHYIGNTPAHLSISKTTIYLSVMATMNTKAHQDFGNL